MRQYVATLRAIFWADDEVVAQVVAEQVRQNGSKDLELDEGDSVDVTDVIPLGFGLSAAETSQVLRTARNCLIRTRIKQCWELARELDKVAYILERRLEEHFDASSYDYGKFMDVSQQVLDGKNPKD